MKARLTIKRRNAKSGFNACFRRGICKCVAVGWLAWSALLSTCSSQTVDPFAAEIEIPLPRPAETPVSPGRISIQKNAPLETETMATFSPEGTNLRTGVITSSMETAVPAAPFSFNESNQPSKPPLKSSGSFSLALIGLLALAIFGCLALFAFLQRSPKA